MNDSTDRMPAALWIDDIPLSNTDVVDLIRRQGAVPRLVQEWVIDRTLADTNLESEFQEQLLRDYRNENDLSSDEAYQAHLQQRHIDETMLLQMLCRPHQVVRYREERWGPFAQSLYLQHKERFDTVTYDRLQAADPDVMQEIYFRLKDGEESWDGLARQFPGAGPEATARRGPVPVAEVEAPVLEVLRQSEPGRVSRPLQLGDQVIVVGLHQFQPSTFDDSLRTVLLRQAFEDWLSQECSRMQHKIRFAR